MSAATRARASAAAAVAKSGKAVVYIRVQAGEAGQATEARYAGKVVLVANAGEGARNASAEFTDRMIRGEYLVALMAASDWPFSPQAGDRIEIDQDTQAVVVGARPTWAGEEVALWRVILER